VAKKWELRFDQARLREAKQMFSEVAKSIDPATSDSQLRALYQLAKKEVEDGLRQAAIYVRDRARQNASSKRAPRRLYTGSRPAIFSFADFDATRDPKRQRSALVGARTGLSVKNKDERLYVTWGRGAKRMKGGTVAANGLSMSMAALFERGTRDRRIKPGRFLRDAFFGTRGYVVQAMTQAYRRALAQLNKAK
jgi:hypothetical protein